MSIAPPSGDVTLMFTDIEGSTQSWQIHGDRFGETLQLHNSLIREVIQQGAGYEVKTVGDAFMVAFSSPEVAARCALDIQRRIEAETFPGVEKLRVRIGMHTAEIEPINGDYFGNPVNRTSRIESAAHGGMILLSDVTAQRIQHTLPDRAILIDLGFHRLKDLSQPQNLFQLTHPDLPDRVYPALKTLRSDRHNIAAQVTSFVGREREMEDLNRLLNSGRCRLITITGPGGTGKTRLSIQVAAERAHLHQHGVWLVELAGVTTVADVPSAMALALGIPLSSAKEARNQIFEYFRERECLLVLDNFEQVVEAARFVSELLRQCPRVTAMITSRELLQVAGEHEFPLAPLEDPPLDASMGNWMTFASLRLFVERSQVIRPNFVVTESNLVDLCEICRRLEGLPLAVELTSALIRGMTPQQILLRLKDRFRLLASTRRDLDPRQRSLRGAIDWSYDLLSVEERSLFAELSVFVGGFDMEAAEAVCTMPAVFDLIYSLRDKSLLRTVETDTGSRFSMLEMLREYASEKLSSENRIELRTRHATFYLRLAQEWGNKLEYSSEAALAQQHFRIEIENMRAGMDFVVHCDDLEQIAAYGRSLARFFISRGLYVEGDQRLAAAEHACRQAQDHRALALLLIQRGRIAFQGGRYADARALYKESYAVSHLIGDTERLIAPLLNIGSIAWVENDFEQARDVWKEGLQLARETRQHRYEAMLLENLGIAVMEEGDFEAASNYYNDALKIYRHNNDERLIAYALMHVGEAQFRKGETLIAYETMQESYRLFVALGRQMERALTAVHLATILLDEVANPPANSIWTSEDRLDRAEVYVDEGLRIVREISDTRHEMHGWRIQARIRMRRQDFTGAFASLRQVHDRALETNDRKEYAHTLEHLADALDLTGDIRSAYMALFVANNELSRLTLHHTGTTEQKLTLLRKRLDPTGLADLESGATPARISLLLSRY